MDKEPLQPPHPRRRDFSEQVTHLPLVQSGDGEVLSETEASHVWQALQDTGSQLPDRIETVTAHVLKEVMAELETVPGRPHTYVIKRHELLGSLIKLAIRTGAQIVVDTGTRMQEAHQLQELYDQPPADDPQAS